jgi:uncharacterized protein
MNSGGFALEPEQVSMKSQSMHPDRGPDPGLPNQLQSMPRFRPLSFVLVLPFLALAAGACNGQNDTLPPMGDDTEDGRTLPPRGHAWVVMGSDTVLAEVADTPEARERGLMFRTELEDGHGMLFVFRDEDIRAFWMRNTYLALDIAYLDRTQRIVDIQAMEPHVEELYESVRPAMFALEVPQGWFQNQGIAVGDQARIIFGRR